MVGEGAEQKQGLMHFGDAEFGVGFQKLSVKIAEGNIFRENLVVGMGVGFGGAIGSHPALGGYRAVARFRSILCLPVRRVAGIFQLWLHRVETCSQ